MSGEYLENRTFDEVHVGDSESITRTLTSQDLHLFAAVSGDVNPAHVDEQYARHFLSGKLVGHSLWSGADIGRAGNATSGAGNRIRVPGPAVSRASARRRHRDRNRDGSREHRGPTIVFDCRCVNQLGEAVATGVAVVRAPTETFGCTSRSPRRRRFRSTASTMRCWSAVADCRRPRRL